ncbi:DUF2510 domain-containing protein [Streptomyces sp. NPDC059785]|uniref:DUF2510 domain-containing protein n=1 Tax=Streptomyces sp. NPDC059785 TaxID=3346945 RepID=UPI00364A3BA7
MTQATPPGWYPDPGQTSDGPPAERWWDGNAWTEQTRPVGSAALWGPPAHPPAAGAYPGAPAGPARRGLRTGIAVAAAIAVLAGIGGGVYALTKDDGGSGTSANSQGPGGQNGQGGPGGQGGGQGGPEGGGPGGAPGDSGGSGGQTPQPGESGQPQTEDGYATDAINGIAIPVPDGWSGASITVGAQVTSDDSYKCPGDTSKDCTKGGAYSAPAVALELEATTAKAAAKEDISKNAEESYGGTTYGKITSHEELASKAVTVAGQKGYMVRWKVVTSKGDDGYVESLAFPSPASSGQLVVVRFGVDVSTRTTVIDQITKGIKESSASGGGSGQDV